MTFRDWLDLAPLDRLRPAAPLAVRAFLCVYLLYMSQDNVRSGARMDEFAAYLAANGFPVPALAARVSVYAQLVCGALLGLGLLTRWAAAVIVFRWTPCAAAASRDRAEPVHGDHSAANRSISSSRPSAAAIAAPLKVVSAQARTRCRRRGGEA